MWVEENDAGNRTGRQREAPGGAWRGLEGLGGAWWGLEASTTFLSLLVVGDDTSFLL